MPNKEIKKTTATKKATEKKVAKKKSTIAMPKEEVKVVESAKKKAATKKKVATPLAASVKKAPANLRQNVRREIGIIVSRQAEIVIIFYTHYLSKPKRGYQIDTCIATSYRRLSNSLAILRASVIS